MDQAAIREAVRCILTAIGEEPDRPGMEATPAATRDEAMRLIRGQ